MNEFGIETKRTPEDREVAAKKLELARLEAELAERELDLITLEVELNEFEQLYLRRVGVLYAELDELNARIAEANAKASPNDEYAQNAASEARAQADKTARETESVKDVEAQEKFKPSDSLKKLYRELARLLHPDLVLDQKEKSRRHELMAKANKAYAEGDEDLLLRMLAAQQNNADEIIGDGIGAELIRLIRQIARAEDRLREIDRKFSSLKESDISRLKQEVDEAETNGRDLLSELAAKVEERIVGARQRINQSRAKNDG